MKNTLVTILALLASVAIANAAEYKLVGQRHLRLYTAEKYTQTYNAAVDAQAAANALCTVPWTRARASSATSTSHVNEQLDVNVVNRDRFDAALFCANHTNGTHRAYANAAVYRYRLPDGALPRLSRLAVRVSSDPYNALGARIVLLTNATGEIPTDCATCRGEGAGGIRLAGVAPRVARIVTEGGEQKSYWYSNATNAVFDLSAQPLQLNRYLYVFVLMENYASSRGNWLEGCSYIDNLVSVTTDAPVPGWTDGSTVDLSSGGYSAPPDEWMPYFETTNTIVTAEKNGVRTDFAAPEHAYRRIHYGSTNISWATHFVSKFDADTWMRGVAATNLSGWTVKAVLPSRRVAVTGRDVYIERGYETDPPSRGTVRSDSDGDGIPDGWEVYVGSDPLDPSDAVSDWDADGLTLAQEYDHGHFPTDPRNADTDRDGILDSTAFLWHLKGSDAAADFDGDGLSNYEEYLASEVFAFGRFDPDCDRTGGGHVDSFTRVGNLYVGEIFGHFASPASKSDGRKNPVVKATVRSRRFGKIVIKAWSDSDDPEMVGCPEAAWTAEKSAATETLELAEPNLTFDGVPSRLTPGRHSFVAYHSADGTYVPGEPLGVVRGVDVGWQGAKFDIELTETSAITPRIKLWEGTSDRSETVDTMLNVMLEDRFFRNKLQLEAERLYSNETEKVEAYIASGLMAVSNRVAQSTASKVKERVRVVRYGIDNMYAYMAGVYETGLGRGFEQRAVLDREFDLNGRGYLSEADFLGPDQFDIDWGTLTGEVVEEDGSPISTVDRAGLKVTNMTYLVVLGDGAQDFRGTEDTGTVVRAHSVMVTRRFEENRTIPVAENLGTVHGSRTTFIWSLKNEDEWASRFGTTYTAFKIQVLDSYGVKVIYDSDVRRLPAAQSIDKQNNVKTFTWTADVYADDKTRLGKIFGDAGEWKWRVVMYNAKFRSDEGGWSNLATLSTAVNAQQEVNDNGYSTVNVAVRYAGPAAVLERYDSASTTGIVHVLAYDTADFSGEPVAQVYVDDMPVVKSGSLLEATSRLIGLPNKGEYFICAYVDSNGNRTRDSWETWGYAKEPVSFEGCSTAPVVGLYMEDADTDNDLIPDAYEYAMAGWNGDFEDIKGLINSSVGSQSKILFSAEFDKFTNGVASISTGLGGASLTFLMNEEYVEELITDFTENESVPLTADEARALVWPRTVTLLNQAVITAFSLDRNAKKLYLYTNADTQTATAGFPLNRIYEAIGDDSATVTVEIYKIDTLAENWPDTPQWTKTATVGKEAERIDVSLSEIDFSSGFFKINVKE